MSEVHRSPMQSKHPAKSCVVTPTDDTLHKRMTAERGVVDELLLVCGVIGTLTSSGGEAKSDELVPVTDCLNWLQDLQRALRRDDDTFRPISLLLSQWKVVPQKLLPLVMTCRYDTPMILTIVKILVILTKPLGEAAKRAGRCAIDTKKYSEMAIKEQIKLRENALAQSDMLMELKRIMTHHPSHSNSKGTGLFSIFVSLLAEPISRTGSARTDTDHLTIELVLHLFRNLLTVEPLLKSSTDASQASVQLHQELVCLFESELVLEILLVIAQDMESRENQNYNLLMMELLNLLLKSQDPTAVARSVQKRPGSNDKVTNVPSEPMSMLRQSLAKDRQSIHNLVATSSLRHSNFGGTLVIQKPNGKRQFFSATLLEKKSRHDNVESLAVKKRRNRKREAFVGAGRTSASHTRSSGVMTATTVPTTQSAARAQQTIHSFCERFLQNCYGPLVKTIKNEFRRDSVRLEEGDTVVFFRIIWFFSQWSRVARKQGSLGHLIFTMDVFSFKLVLGAMDSYLQHKKYPQLAQTTALYSEMMHLLLAMHSSKDSTENIMALGLMDTLFYGNEPLDRLPKLLSGWAPGTSTREHLCDLVEVVHMTLKLLETNAASFLDEKIQDSDKANKEIKKKDAISNMTANAQDFDVNSYLLRKLISNQTVSMYTHLLSQYSVNAPHVNHRILSFLLRFQKIKIACRDEENDDGPTNPLVTETVTLEPMLFHIQLLMVLNQILNDPWIRNNPEFEHLLSFSARTMKSFSTLAKKNPLLYVECLFHHPLPHRYCEQVTNFYVNEELRLIAERELLLEEERRMMLLEEAEKEKELAQGDDDIDEPNTNSLDPCNGAAKPRIPTPHDSDDEEIEWNDGKDSGMISQKDKNRGVIMSDCDSDNENVAQAPIEMHDALAGPPKSFSPGKTIAAKREVPITKKATLTWDSESDDENSINPTPRKMSITDA